MALSGSLPGHRLTTLDNRAMVRVPDVRSIRRLERWRVFAVELRKLRRSAGNPGYRELVQRAHYSAATPAEAAAGVRLPTLPVTLAYVRGLRRGRRRLGTAVAGGRRREGQGRRDGRAARGVGATSGGRSGSVLRACCGTSATPAGVPAQERARGDEQASGRESREGGGDRTVRPDGYRHPRPPTLRALLPAAHRLPVPAQVWVRRSSKVTPARSRVSK
jgi:hypothetical protein